VALLLTPEMQKCIDILLKYREKAGVNTFQNVMTIDAAYAAI